MYYMYIYMYYMSCILFYIYLDMYVCLYSVYLYIRVLCTECIDRHVVTPYLSSTSINCLFKC